jgi:hypothetical protein
MADTNLAIRSPTRTTAAVALPIISLGVGILGTLFGSGTASADVHGTLGDQNEYAYATELYDQGFKGSIADARSAGALACSQRTEGVGQKPMMDFISTLPGVTPGLAVAIVMGAEFHFCTEHVTWVMPSSSVLQ